MISVVIPLYNKAPHIGRAIDSVLAQTVPPFEIIVVDDGSTDGGGEIVAKSYGGDVVLIRQLNQGVSAARNRGLVMAQAPYVAFLDADDEWRPHHLQELTELIRVCSDGVLFSSGHLIARDGHHFRPRSAFSEGWRGYVTNFFAAYAKGLSLVNSSTACVHKKALLGIGGFPAGMKRGEDIVTWIKLSLTGPVAHVEIPTVIYHQMAVNRADSLRESEPPGSLQFMAELLEKKDILPATRSGIRRLFERIAFFTAAGFAMNGDRVGLRAIRSLAWRQQRFGLAAAIMLLGYIPRFALRSARRWRHKTA